MFRARKQLGKRQTADSGNGFRPKKFRTDQQVPTIDDGQSASSTDGAVPDGADGAATGNVLLDCEIPRYGTPVERKRCRKAGDFVIGYELGTSPGVPQTQYLARKQGSNEFYLLKILSFDPETEIVDKETLQGKVLLHNEFTLLSMLDDLDGVIHQHGFFSDYAFEERQIERDDGTVESIYTGRIRRRLILVLDCVHAHEFCDESSAYISLQRHISVARLSERKALKLFYEVVKVVEQLHARNIIHRDLKLNNIVLDRRTGRIILTNFFLGKHLINEQECLYDQRGSPAYISPDVLGGKPYRGKPSDMWALGVILYTIVYGKFPFLDTTPSALFRKIREADYTIPSGFNTSQETKTLIKRMLTLNPDERLTAWEVRTELEQILRRVRRPRTNCDQLVPELADVEPSLTGDKLPPADQSIPTGKETVGSSSTVEPMDVDPIVNGSEKTFVNPSPKFDLSTEQFSRILEATVNQRRTEECSKAKGERTYKVKTTTYRFTPSNVACQVHRQQNAAGDAVLVGGQNTAPLADQQSAMGGRRPSTTTAGGVDQALVSGGAGRNWSRFNFNLNLQYTASSYNSAARAVAAAIAAVHSVGTSSAVNRTRTERTRNDPNGNGPNATTADRPSLPRLVSVSQTVRMVRSAGGSQQQQPASPQPLLINASDANGGPATINTEPIAVDQQANRPSLASLPPAAQRLYAIMNYISLNNSRQPAAVGNTRSTMTLATSTAPASAHTAPLAEHDPTLGLDFNGVITPEIADKIVAYLIVNLRSLDWVANVFRSLDGAANDPELRVNNLLELLRQLGVRMEACNGQIVIRAEQTRERLQFLSLLLRIAGYNDKYFHQRSS
ncbi:serine/threonine-protein kinase par-1-like [Anopheles maculipalpis]|uniref:serine/threonine-protein kinase par-1-like n=1 Tax=Anopheles maculipalpis TaxID=1496333 RepID=UPI002158C3A1|nr:serine/threonine-protein kinase par-1-like [Anopheles maculipalpis]